MKFSVIIPSFNREEQTIAAVNSVLKQTYKNFELIVIEDGSSSLGLERVVLEAGQNYFGLEENRGVSCARNFAVSKSSGEYLAFLDSDDLWLENKLERQRDYFIENPDCKIMQSDEIWIRNGVRVNPKKVHAKPEGDVFKKSLKLCCISPSAVVIRRDLFDEVGGFDEEMRVCEDYDLWLRISARERVGFLDEKLVVKYGGHADQLSRSVEAIDRFRVYSMRKLLGSGVLSDEQVQMVREEMEKKVAVLMKGAIKRGNKELIDFCQGV